MTLEVERSTSTAHRLLEYEGVCANVHGHNFHWEVELVLSMEVNGEDNMGVDFKEVSDTIDRADHATLLNDKDPILNHTPIVPEDGKETQGHLLGDVVLFEGDPTVELVSKWMARELYKLDEVVEHVTVKCNETEQYGLTATYPEDEDSEMAEDTQRQ
jgi:6-pyruvoyl-tetrahydropterin synthase